MNKNNKAMHSGLPEFDQMLGGVNAGDNIVFQVNAIEDYIPFVHPFCQQTIREERQLIYFRFAQHVDLLPQGVQAQIYYLHPEKGFEAFISEIFDIIEEHGYGSCYVFDCLSELTADWYSDRMLGNFFMLTCPLLYDFETATYFALFKNMHTDLALNAIHNTAQVVLDVYRNENTLYVHPLKVIGRFSQTMYMLHVWKNREFIPVTNSATISEILANIPKPWTNFSIQREDLWMRSFLLAYKILQNYPLENNEAKEKIYKRLLRMIISRDSRFLELAEKYFDIERMLEIGKRLIGTGLVGGKSAGMLLARAILEKDNPRWKQLLEAHDSFFIGSDVYYTFLIQNKLFWKKRELLKQDEFDATAINNLKALTIEGKFPDDIQKQFYEVLEYFGQLPIIVRSSSRLEDAYGNAFSGKYDSIFCANQGTPEERFSKFIYAVKLVYASTMKLDALVYRKHFDLLDREEQMSLLIQRVSGAKYNDMYFPQVAGVGFSFNPFVWNADIKPESGMLRLVFGLGTRAVDRSDDDYTRIVALNAPQRLPESNVDNKQKYTQKKIDIMDLSKNSHASRQFADLVKNMTSDLPLDIFATRDLDLEARAKEYHVTDVFSYVLTFDKLLRDTNFVGDMRSMLETLQKAYNHPVDIEFTLNFLDENQYKINLVQCRPFQTRGELSHVELPENISQNRVILKTMGPIIGNSIATALDRIIYIVPQTYSNLGIGDRYAVARLIGNITRADKTKRIALIGPGRWGTTSPSLGVPVTFAEINTVALICEIAEMHEGLVPDVSLGTHFFNDLVEMDILYLAVYPERAKYIVNHPLLRAAESSLLRLFPTAGKWDPIVRVIDTLCLINANVITQQGIFYLA